MYVRVFALFIFAGVLGSFTEARSGVFGYPYEHGGLEDTSSPTFFASSRSKRAVDSNGETTTRPTTTQATTMNPTTTDPTTTPSPTTPPPTTTPSTPSTEPTTPTTTTPITTITTEATSPTTTPTTTSATTPTTTSATTPTSTSETTTPTTPSTTTPESTKPTSKPKKSPNDLEPRSNFDESEPEDSSKKPGSPSKGDKDPASGFPPYFGFPGSFGPGLDPFFGYPGFNSIPGSGPNYAWTGTNNGPGFASAGASAGSFAGGYPGGMGYPVARNPGTGSPGSVGSRGGFQDNTPKPNGYGYGGVDPLYNAGPGFYPGYYPGQFPGFQDPSEMIRQIQAQIEAQHQAIAKSVASNQGSPFASNIPNRGYSYSASPSMNNVRYPTFGNSLNTGDSNMELHNRLANEAANYGGGSYGGGSYGGDGSYGPQIASASIGLSPRGGFQSGIISPAAPGIESRFAEDLPAPSGNSFGVFASSSSSSKTGPDGKTINHKSSITGVNDNGKISYRTVHD